MSPLLLSFPVHGALCPTPPGTPIPLYPHPSQVTISADAPIEVLESLTKTYVGTIPERGTKSGPLAAAVPYNEVCAHTLSRVPPGEP